MIRIPNDMKMMFRLLAFWLTFYIAKAISQEPRFNLVTRNVTVVTGQTAVLPCSVNYLGTYKIVWQSPRGKTLTFEDRRIISDDRFSVERPYVNEWNLHLRMVKTSDAGTYQCQINTDPVQVRGVILHVNEPARIIEHLSSGDTVNVREGATVELTCNVTGFPTPTVTWYRTHTGLLEAQEDVGRKRVGNEGEILVIYNVSRYCDDKYECVAYNGVPPAASKEIRVYVEFPPEVRLPNKRISQALGKSTILECEITAYPQILSIWRKNGKDITRNQKYTTEMYTESGNKVTLSLRIQALTEEDFGEYECYSLNLLGNDSETMVLLEYHKPEEKTSTAATITSPWSENLDRLQENPHFWNGENRQRNPNSPLEEDHWGDSKGDTGHSEDIHLKKKNGDYSSSNDLNYPRNRYEPEAKSGPVISSHENKGGRLVWTSIVQVVAVLLLLVHSFCIR